ncbi:MAG: PspC domain-containing protein [Steroidobacteraceae bacterium]
MRKVTTVSLNGTAYQLEDAAYESVRAYLDQAGQALAGNPDRIEILADLEQAIADKCDAFLGKQKNVVLAHEARQILAEMGPVDGAQASAWSAEPAAPEEEGPVAPSQALVPRRKRLFRLPTEGMMGGVCAGLAAYFSVDVVWVRLAFVLLTFFTGIWFFAWLTLLIVMPAARTPEQMAAARGDALSAREVMEMAKKKSAEFSKAAASGLQDAGRNLRETFGR